MLPPEYYARCCHTSCSWQTITNQRAYRDQLVEQHTNRYGHPVSTHDYP